MIVKWTKKYTEAPNLIFEKKDGSKMLVIRKYKDEPMWDYFIVHPQRSLTDHVYEMKFKTRSAALKYAKRYMKFEPKLQHNFGV